MVLTSFKLHSLNLMLVTTLFATQQTMQMKFRYRLQVIYVKKENSVRDIVYMIYFPFKSIIFLCIDTGRCSSKKTYFDTLR